ncbi:MAG: DMT family transporter [Rhodobacteraceae bacterium]|nr:DMT family transporter [Paracoccaceae bacterium]
MPVIDAVAGKSRRFLFAALLLIGAIWGLTVPLTKLAVSTGHGAFGLVVWEMFFGVLVLAFLVRIRGRFPRIRSENLGLILFISIFGTLIPTSLWFLTARYLPAGIMAIIISLAPMFTLPVALMIGLERFSLMRLTGLMLGALSVALLTLPETSLPEASMIGWLLLALGCPLCYGIEGNGVARMGLGGLDPVEALLGASVISLLAALPLALASGQWFGMWRPWGQAEYALLASSVLTVLAYAGYVWLVTEAGSVFAAQVSYLVTGFGVFWSISLLEESYSGWVWLALMAMLAGLFLVVPKQAGNPLLVQPDPLAPAAPNHDNRFRAGD